jgi:hypothetical protein
VLAVLAVLAGSPTPRPTPIVTPGSTSPIADILHWAMLDGLITIGAAIGSIASIIGVYRTLVVVTRGRRQQDELVAMQRRAFARQAVILAYLGIDDQGRKLPPAPASEPEPGDGDLPGMSGPGPGGGP